MGKRIGIDLGTTYSCVAYVNEDGALEVLKNSDGFNTTPSIVFFESESNVVVGEQARSGAAFSPENLIERVKSLMGDKDYTIEKFGVDYSPSSISSLILRKLKEDAEMALNDTVDGVVITCPAYFGTIARGATQKAAEDAGLNVLQIINEPTAAAFAYAYTKNEDVNKTVLIYDLGGGTFDCTILKMEFNGDDKNLRVVASTGDHTLGGKDWDAAFISHVINEFCSETGVEEDEIRSDLDTMNWFSENIEKFKKQLSARESVKIAMNFQGTKQHIEVSRDTFNSVTEDLLNKTIYLVDDMLKNEGISIDQIDEIILVGGSTRMPQVSARLEAEYGKTLISFEPDEAVAKGAALMAKYAYTVNENAEAGSVSDGNTDNSQDDLNPFVEVDSNQGFSTAKGKIVVDDIINKSYGIKVWDRENQKNLVVNLIKTGTVKPCSGNNEEIMPLVIGGATSITVCESDEKDDIVEYGLTIEVFNGPLNLPQGLDPETPVTVSFDLNQSAILTIRTICNGIETILEFNPTTGGASTAGSDAAKKLSLS